MTERQKRPLPVRVRPRPRPDGIPLDDLFRTDPGDGTPGAHATAGTHGGGPGGAHRAGTTATLPRAAAPREGGQPVTRSIQAVRSATTSSRLVSLSTSWRAPG